ncbi:hypothetical protein M2480_003086 [Parabacteroides sp. PFB2-12]|uniref:DUF4258 domain-containing protein n=1 Tax=unclassified Parabacteroides TaxID=2649774 RepID=UPI0024753000|nr:MULTISPECIES: DUF4258 domain-containing protein [unclassified Parabacteroides]MDH6344171.1 hypothetical protein [Parabacteroides sp. PM6-13]MDH6392078.1 hypothetical protein [Parabacteroides sp. PFB2-12]
MIDGFGASAIGQLGKGVAVANGLWHQTVKATGSFAPLGPSITSEAGIGGLEITVTSGKIGESTVSGMAAQAGKGAVNVGKTGGAPLVKTGAKFSQHALERMAQRDITQDMAELAIRKGQKFYDPLNKSINYILPNSFASGKSLLVGTNPLTGEVTTVLRSSKNLIKPRMIPIP